MESEWNWDKLDPTERRIAELLAQGKGNAAICQEVFLSRARVQECIKRILIKTGTSTTRGAIALLVQERENQTLLRILDEGENGVAILQDRLMKFANKALREMFGYELEEMVDVPFVELGAPRVRDQQAKRYDDRMQGKPFPGGYTAAILCKDGQEKDVIVSSAGLIQFKGRPALLALIVPAAEK